MGVPHAWHPDDHQGQEEDGVAGKVLGGRTVTGVVVRLPNGEVVPQLEGGEEYTHLGFEEGTEWRGRHATVRTKVVEHCTRVVGMIGRVQGLSLEQVQMAIALAVEGCGLWDKGERVVLGSWLWTCVGFRCSAGDDAARAGWSRCRWLRGHAAGGCVVTMPVAATCARATVGVLASRCVLWMAAAVSHGPALGNAEVCQHGGDFLVAALALVEGSAHRVAMCASRIACRKGRSCILCIAAQRLARCNPMHNQPPDILRSRQEAFPWAGVWVDLPLSAVSDRDDTTPASVRAGRSAEAVACPALCRAGILCTAQQTSRNFPLLRAYGP